jgi:4-aminobutyrate aminotransferase
VSFRESQRIRSIMARDKKIMLTSTKEAYSFVPSHGEGEFIYDIDGNKFIDFSSFISVYNFGVGGNKEIRKAIKDQVSKLTHAASTDFYSEEQVLLAEEMLKLLPRGFGRFFFSNSGTEANEAAVKFSKLFTKRQYIMAFYNSFHGRTMGSLGLTSSKVVQRRSFGPFNASFHAPYAYCYRCPFGKEYPSCGLACVDYIKKYPLSREVPPDEIAAIIMEPIQGEGGYIVPPRDFVKEIRKLADENGIVLIDDEVQAGYFRTGKFTAISNFGVEPDIYSMAKAVGGGLPMGVTVTKRSLGDVPYGAHSTTFGGNLAAVAAARASLSYAKRNWRRIERGIESRSRLMFSRLNRMKDEYEIVGDVRGIGMMIGVELVKDKKSKEPAEEEQERVLKECFSNNLVLLPAGASSIRIIPPLEISFESLRKGLDILEDAISNADKSLRGG